jgi:hypothetical protein
VGVGGGWKTGTEWRLETRRQHERAPCVLPRAPGDTKSCSATPAVQPAGGRPPTPAPRATKERAQRGDARPARPGYPRRRRGSRVTPSAAEPRRAPGRGDDRSRVPSTALPSFLEEPRAACAHPRAETEHRRGAARRPPGRRREAAAATGKRIGPAPRDVAAAHSRPLAPAGWRHRG